MVQLARCLLTAKEFVHGRKRPGLALFDFQSADSPIVRNSRESEPHARQRIAVQDRRGTVLRDKRQASKINPSTGAYLHAGMYHTNSPRPTTCMAGNGAWFREVDRRPECG